MPPLRLPLPAALAGRLRRQTLDLPGAGQRRRMLAAALLAGLALLLRPWPPFQWLPGWVIGALLLWALVEAMLWQWRPHRWR